MREDIRELFDIIKSLNVPKGFKRIDFGIVNEEFEEVKILDLGELKNGINFSQEEGKYSVKFLGVGDFGNKTILENTDRLEKISVSIEEEKLEPYFLKNDDIVFVRSNGSRELVGRNLLIQNLSEKVVYSGFCIRFRLKQEQKKTSIKYINAWLDNGVLKKLLKKENRGTNISNLNQQILGKLRIYVPKMDEQQKIVDVIEKYNKMLLHMEQLIDYKQKQKYWLMQNLLTGRRKLLIFRGQWKKVHLYEIVNKIEKKKFFDNVDVLTISAQYGLISQRDFFKKEIASKNKENYYLLERDDFAYNKSYSGDYAYGAVKRLKNYDKGIVSPLYICFRVTDKNVSLDYLEYYFEFGMADREIGNIAQEGARNHGLLNISSKDFFNIKIVLPPYDEQKAIAKVLETADKEINLLEQKLELIKQEKKAIMQLLLTGIVRVNET